MTERDFIINPSDPVLITGSNGFIGSRVVETLLAYGFTNLRCLVRPSSNLSALERIKISAGNVAIEAVKGNLLSPGDCGRIVQGVSVIFHLAAGRGEKSYPDAYMNSVVTSRNLLDAVVGAGTVKRFVNISSFAVYSTESLPSGGLLDESCEVESEPHLRGEAYCYAKVRQEEMVTDYSRKYGIPCVILRPGVVYGPGNRGLTGRVGIGTFGIFLHLGGGNQIPLSYVDNCAEAIVLAGLKRGVDGEVFNVVDDDLPTSRQLLRMYKRHVRQFHSVYLPHWVSYLLCRAWEKYSERSEGQIPPAFNRKRWSSYWKGNAYSNSKIKNLLGWRQRVSFADAAERYFAFQRETGRSQ